MPKHGYAAGLASSSPLFPSCLPRAAGCYAAHAFVSSVLSIQKLRKKTAHWRPWWVRLVATKLGSVRFWCCPQILGDFSLTL